MFRSFDDVGKNPKFCVSCGDMATKEALFDVEDAMSLEKYCDTCAEKEAGNRYHSYDSNQGLDW